MFCVGTMICERVLEDAGAYGRVTVGELHLDLVAVDSDVLTLEMPLAYRDLWV